MRRRLIRVLDVDLADTRVGTSTAGTRDLDLEDLTVLGALILDIFFDIYS